eukprot:220551-Hanusia_phi.AAC.2
MDPVQCRSSSLGIFQRSSCPPVRGDGGDKVRRHTPEQERNRREDCQATQSEEDPSVDCILWGRREAGAGSLAMDLEALQRGERHSCLHGEEGDGGETCGKHEESEGKVQSTDGCRRDVRDQGEANQGSSEIDEEVGGDGEDPNDRKVVEKSPPMVPHRLVQPHQLLQQQPTNDGPPERLEEDVAQRRADTRAEHADDEADGHTEERSSEEVEEGGAGEGQDHLDQVGHGEPDQDGPVVLRLVLAKHPVHLLDLGERLGDFEPGPVLGVHDGEDEEGDYNPAGGEQDDQHEHLPPAPMPHQHRHCAAEARHYPPARGGDGVGKELRPLVLFVPLHPVTVTLPYLNQAIRNFSQ